MGTPSVTAVKYLFANSRNLCFFNIVDGDDRKTCEVRLTERGHARVLGQVAHISSDQPLGPRYDSSLSESERQGESNLLLLCPNCHKHVDDVEPDRFTIDDLRQMKERHLSHAAEDWRPHPATVSQVAEDMVAYFVERIRRTSDGVDFDDDDAPKGVMGSCGIGYLSDEVGPIEARQMWVDAWRSGQTPESLERFRHEQRRDRQLERVLERHGLSGVAFLQNGDDGTLTVGGAIVGGEVLRELDEVGDFSSVRNLP